jgi:hypothetical protein
MRTALLIASLPCLAGCGTVCDEVAAAQNSLATKGQPCNNSNSTTTYDSAKCNAGLSKCSADDMKAMATYAQCLDQQPVCNPSTSLSWSLAVVGCAQALGGVSLSCATATR